MKLNTVGAAYALWLLAIEVVFFLVRGHDTNALEYVVVLGAVPVALQIFLLGLNPYGLGPPTRMSLVFLLIVLLSYISNLGDWSSLTYIIELLVVFGIAIVVAGCVDPALIRTIAIIYSILSALFLLYVDFTGEYVWGRLAANGIDPNWWGLMASSVTVTAFAHRSRLLGGLCFGVGVLTMYFSSTRGSMVALLVSLAVLALLYAATLRGQRLVIGIGAVAASLVLLVVLMPYIDNQLVNDVMNDVFKVDDPYRGVGEGFTGRTDLWEYSIDLWQRLPLFGVGFRQHEAFMPGNLSAHNAYLAMLIDTGIVGFLWYVALIGLSLLASLRVPDARTRNLLVVTIVTYLMIGLFERRALNGGNPFSIYFLMCCIYALAQRHWHRALDAYARFIAPPPEQLSGSS